MLRVNFDGSCGPRNPGGQMGWGVVIRDGEGKLIQSLAGRKSEAPGNSNNVAEYMALNAAMNWLLEQGHAGDRVEILGDSNLVILQMNRKWKVKQGHYFEEALRAKETAKRFKNISFKWVRRCYNEDADVLSKV